MFVDFEDRLNIFDTHIICRFYRDLYTWDQLEGMIGAVTGMDANTDSLKEKAGAISTVVRNFKIREGLRPEDDRLPKRLHQRLEDIDKTITEAELKTVLRDYYRLRGWDDQGHPPC